MNILIKILLVGIIFFGLIVYTKWRSARYYQQKLKDMNEGNIV